MSSREIRDLIYKNSFWWQFAVVGLFFLGLYWEVIIEMARDWDANPNFSHGYFVPFITAAMIYSRRESLKNNTVAPSNWGVIFLAVGLSIYFIAHVGAEFFLQRSSMVICLFGIFMFLGGMPYVKIVFFPLLYLFLMIPIPAVVWSIISFPMQLFSSRVAESVIGLTGIPIFREGNVLHLAETSLEVVDACSGLRSLTTMIALSFALAYFSKTSNAKRGIIFILAIPIAVFINIVRLTFTAIMANRYGEEMAQGFLHDFSGWLTFVFGLAILWVLSEIILKFGKKHERI